MFERNPDLLNVFNQANQAIGEQPIALASSIVAYAHHLLGESDIDFDHVLSRIANKHVALAIKPGDYTIVGRNLMEAIGEVLGDAVTPEVARAWEEVYWLFAMDLVSTEAKLYQQIERTPDSLMKDHRITRIEDAGGNARTFTLEPVDGSSIPDYVPGQYVSVIAQLEDDYRQPRQYTISGAPGDAALQITVKKVLGVNGNPDGAVSGYLFERSHPLREQVARTAADAGAITITYYEEGGDDAREGLVAVDELDLPDNAEYYLCGSVPFMQHVRSGLLDRGVDAADISYEIFGPDLWLGGSASSQASPEELVAEEQRLA